MISTEKPVHEIKFVVGNERAHVVREWLKQACTYDSEFPCGTVSSIYYDTRNWRFLDEKLNSDYLKSKVRVRWYSDIKNNKHSSFSFAEAKLKTGNRRKKIRVKTSCSGEWLSTVNLENRELLKLPHLLYSEGFRFSESLFPVYQISYKRLRFLEPSTGARICLDYDISAPRVNPVMLPEINPFNLKDAVFEIKGSEVDLPRFLYPLTDLGCRKASFSKYSMCYQNIRRVVF